MRENRKKKKKKQQHINSIFEVEIYFFSSLGTSLPSRPLPICIIIFCFAVIIHISVTLIGGKSAQAEWKKFERGAGR